MTYRRTGHALVGALLMLGIALGPLAGLRATPGFAASRGVTQPGVAHPSRPDSRSFAATSTAAATDSVTATALITPTVAAAAAASTTPTPAIPASVLPTAATAMETTASPSVSATPRAAASTLPISASPSVSSTAVSAAPQAQARIRANSLSSDPAAPVEVTIGSVSGSFYDNPNNSGSFDVSVVRLPAFTEQFQTIDFNPPASSDVQSHCNNPTGINEYSRPFGDVIPQSDGSCLDQVAQSADGSQQAGVGGLYAFEAVFTTTLTVAQAGQVTFNFYSDDGWLMSMGQGPNGAQPTYVSGPMVNAPPAGPFTGYQVVGAYNQVSAPAQNQLTVNFPAAGAYPVEVDYTECCGGQLALTLGTAYRNPILPQTITGPSDAETHGGFNPFAFFSTICNSKFPVNCDTGEFWHTFDDLTIPGRGSPLQFSRTYNSFNAGQDGPLGYGWTDTYNAALTTDATGAITVTAGNGSATTYAPTAAGGYQAAGHIQTTLVANGDGTLTLTDKNQQKWVFAAPTATTPGHLLKEIDRNGYVTSLDYDAQGHLATVTDPAGRALTVTANVAGRIAGLSDPSGRTVQFAYDSAGNLTAVTDVAGGVTHFTYDANHQLLTITDPRGGVATNVYDSAGRVTSQTDPMGRMTTWSYVTNPDGSRTTTMTDPKGNATVETYENNELVSLTKGSGTPQAATWTYSYDPVTLGVTAVTDPDGHTSYNTYDAQGNKLTHTDALGRTTTNTYDALNDLTSITDPAGVMTQYSYDANGNLVSLSRPLTQTNQVATTTLTYDPAHPGDVVARTDPDGHTWRFVHDAYGNIVSASDPLSGATTYRYDLIGREIAMVSPRGNVAGANPLSYTTTMTYNPLSYTTTMTYNSFGETTAITDALGHALTYQYDPDQNLVATTDARGHTTHYTYDADNEKTGVAQADGTTMQTAYDADGNVTAQTDGLKRTTTDSYDPLNRVVGVTDPLNRTTTYSYDAVGNRTATTDPLGRTTTDQYDKANELTGIGYSDGATPNVTYTYTPDGQRASMSDGTGTTTYAYDTLNRLIQTTNGAEQTVGDGYDLAGNLTTLTYPGGAQVTRGYDGLNRVTSITDWLGHTTRYTYDPDNDLLTQTYPNTTTASMTYNAADQLTGIVDSRAGAAFWAFAYNRDQVGQLATATDPIARLQHGYNYDALDRLTGDQATGTLADTTSAAYDAASELTTVADTATRSSATLGYDAASELTQAHVVAGTATQDNLALGYNADGDRTTEADSATGLHASAGFDQADRLITVTVGTTPTMQARYSYDGDGLRASKVVSGTAERFTWDLAAGLPGLLQDGTTRYVLDPDGLPLEQIDGAGAVLYYYHDQIGSTRGLLNGGGQVVAAYTYGPYGTRVGVGSASTPFGYAGQYTDAETGLQYLRARYYDPTTAQFLTRDPLTTLTGQPYTYAADDPTTLVDPSGLCSLGPIHLPFWGSGPCIYLPNRFPDYLTVQGGYNFAQAYGLGFQVGLSYTRSGHIFVNIGPSWGTPGGSAYAGGGYINAPSTTPSQVDNFTNGLSASLGGAIPVPGVPGAENGLGASVVWGNLGQYGQADFGYELLAGNKQLAVSLTYACNPLGVQGPWHW